MRRKVQGNFLTVQFTVQTNYFILKKRICSCISCNGNLPQQCCIHFLNEMVMLFKIEPICNCEMIPNHATCSLKNPGRSPGALCSNHTKPTMLPFCCLLPFVSTYHREHRSGYKKRWTKNNRLEWRFFQRFRGYHLRLSHLVFAWLFPVIDRIQMKWPNKSSQFGHNVQNIRLGNNVSISFNIIGRKATERSQQKTGFCTFLLKN